MSGSLRYFRWILGKQHTEVTIGAAMFDDDDFFLFGRETLTPYYHRVLPERAVGETLRKLKAAGRIQRLNHRMTLLFLLFMVGAAFGIFGYYMSLPASERGLSLEQIKKKKEAENKFLFFVSDGDNWLSQRRYHNAIFQYKKALELKPGNYNAQYRLAMAYNFRCVATGVDCEKAETSLGQLQAYQPNDPNLLNMWKLYYSTK